MNLERKLTRLISGIADDGFYDRYYRGQPIDSEWKEREEAIYRQKSDIANRLRDEIKHDLPYLELGIDHHYRVYHYVNDYYLYFRWPASFKNAYLIDIRDRHYKLIGETVIHRVFTSKNGMTEVVPEAVFVESIEKMKPVG